jgi:hypothetical protein
MGLFNRNSMGSMPGYRKNSGLKTIFAIISIVFAAFFINYPFSFFIVPESIMKFENWIIFAGGILIVLGMVNYMRASKRTMFT